MRVYPCCYSGSVSEWLPWALSRTRHRVSCSKQLWRNSNTLLFSPWPVLQNIVCTSVILPTPWARRGPPPLPPPPPSQPSFISRSLSALLSIFFSHAVALITASFDFFFFPLTQRYSQANTPTRFLTLTPIHKHTKGLEDAPCVRSHSLNVSGPLQPAQSFY